VLYTFGLKHKGYNNVITGRDHKYGFGGKEYNDELGLDWYDVSARNYDPALGRWMNLDPLAEKMRRHSPYNFGFDSPIMFMDYDGMAPTWVPDDKGNLVAEKGDNATTYAKAKGYADPKGKGYHKAVAELADQGITANENGVLNLQEGQTVSQDNNMTRAIENSNGITTEQNDGTNNNSVDFENDSYICHAGSKSAVVDEEINPTNSKSETSVETTYNTTSEHKEFQSNLTEVSSSEAVSGKTIVTFGQSHSAVFYNRSKDGKTNYLWSKNGRYVKPEISKQSKIKKMYGKGNKARYWNYTPNSSK